MPNQSPSLAVMQFTQVRMHYIRAGLAMAEACETSSHRRELAERLAEWIKWEKEYARRGYQTIALTTFISYRTVARLRSLTPGKLGVLQHPIFHASNYAQAHSLMLTRHPIQVSKDRSTHDSTAR